MAVNRIKGAFAVPRKGETFELRAGLVSQYAYERKEAIQKTIMSMTLGKDVSALFPDVLKNIATADLDQKKLVYLYLMNYAKSHPDLCILAVNTFVQDSEDPNPLVRALAIRTMGCIRVDKMVDYMEEPLRKTLRDESPYVRKTAAICVAKLFDLNPTMCLENGFLETLQELIGDPNPMVVANSVTALAEISEAAPETRALVITPATLKKMLLALNECTEWGRVTILSTLANYKASDVKESEHICERVSPQFQHVNPSVVLAAVKVVFLHMRHISPEPARQYLKKMAPPLVTLVSSAAEVQYVALRNIDLLLQKQPDILSKELRVFFCKYNDPPYVKLQKLEIMVRIANDKNVDQLLAELKEYALEVDMDFVRRAVKAIGQAAIKIESASEKCVNTLLDLINTKVNYVVQEAIVVIKDIFRKYPGYEGIIPTLCKCIDELDEPNARGSLIWIVGEYAEKIDNADEILASFVEGFMEEFTQASHWRRGADRFSTNTIQTQLQILTAVVKLFLKKPDQSQSLVQKVLQAATAENDNPDIRDRAYVYWRLLSSDPQVAKNIVLSDKPPITTTIESLPPSLLEQLLTEISTLASVYHKPPETFIGQGRFGADSVQKAAIEEQMQNARENPIAAAAVAAAVSGGPAPTQNNAENLLDFDFDGAAPASLQKAPTSGSSGLEGLAGTPQRVSSPAVTSPVVGSGSGGGNNNLDDLMGVFSNGGGAAQQTNGGSQDMMNGFAEMDLGGFNKPPPPGQQMQGQGDTKKNNEDILGLF
ncbi:MAG: beta-adaptin [Pycnora praestabilis]|nr:MAG: beta-adaptin [Pycnora praestabilis]